MADGGRGPKGLGKNVKICVKEEFKIAVKIALDKFRLDENQKDLEFPSSFTSVERAYIHRLCQGLGLKTKSQGKGSSRFLVASKKDVKQTSSNSKIKLCRTSSQCIDSLMRKFPLNAKEKVELLPKTERLLGSTDNGRTNKENRFIGKLSSTPPQVPTTTKNNDLTPFRSSLPIFSQRSEILKLINEHQVVMVSGETGSGKTTQVPQFILENSSCKSTPCRIVCTQPRRISALSVAERVAVERGEKVGQTVGYQIRLESRVSPKTVLTYCTNGVLLRTLMQRDNCLSYITHIIVDEIHERDRFADFLLIALRDILAMNKKIKLILMSAALDIKLFVEYFGHCPVVNVPGRCYEVKELFLEDILGLTGYQNKAMERHFNEKGKVNSKLNEINKILEKSLQAPSRVQESLSQAEPKAKDVTESLQTEFNVETKTNESVVRDTSKKVGGNVELFEEELDSQSMEDKKQGATEENLDKDSEEKDSDPQFIIDDDVAEEDADDMLPNDDDDDDADDEITGEENDGNNDTTDDITDAVTDDVTDDITDESNGVDTNGGYDANDEGEDLIIEDDDDDDDMKDINRNIDNIVLENINSTNTRTYSKQDEDDSSDEEAYLKKEMDDSISDAWLNGSDDSFVQILHLIMNENISVDYQHSETQATALMVASGRGCVGVVEQLISLGANPNIREPKNGWTALDWAKKWQHTDVIEMLENYMTSPQVTYTNDLSLEKQSSELSEETKELLALYHKTFDDERVDLDLITSILAYICSLGKQGAVLVFLPGYDEIITLRDRLLSHEEYGNNNRYQIFTLHSSMQPSEQRKVFKKLPPTVRKMILSTNIAETSITVDDVVFVIDCGKVKEKSFDALTSVSTLQQVWISKASAVQRRGRAGRCSPGVCFHMFSRVRYESFQAYQVPELLRIPLQELCLHTKLLAGPSTSIADFLAKAPEPPAYLVLRNAVALLKTIDALDKWEDLTDIGRHLADLPVEPRLGKMILYSVVLKCIDPIITIACALAYRDPFILPMYASEKRLAALAKRRFILDPFSDHLLFVKAFRGWQRAKAEGYDKSFCQRNYLSPATLEMMAGMRSQIIGLLKACGFVRPRGAGDIRDLNSNSNNWAVVKAALCAGMYPRIARIDRSTDKLTTPKESKVRLHMTSVLYQAPEKKETQTSAQAKSVKQIPSDWLVYEEMTRMYTNVSIKCCTALSPITVSLFTGPSLSSPNLDSGSSKSRDQDRRNSESRRESESSDSETDENKPGDESRDSEAELKLDEWISLIGNEETIHLTSYLRHKLQALFIRRIRSPSRPWSQVDEAIVRATVAVLSAEEETMNPSLYPKQRKARQDFTSESRGFRDERPRAVERFSSPKDRYRESTGTHWKNSRQSNSPIQQTTPRKSLESAQPRHSPQQTEKLNDARYFIMKCNNQRNLSISMTKGIWATTIANEKKLNRAYRESKMIVLIFSVQGSGHFQGFAHMTSPIGREKSPEFGSSSLGGVFKVDWIKKANIPFQEAHHLVNPWNDNKKVQISRDGQELEPSVGRELCTLWDKDSGSSNSRYTKPSTSSNRRGRQQGPSQPEQQPNHWHQPAQQANYTSTQQMFTPHAASMPIPVPLPSQHTHSTLIQGRYPHQPRQVVGQAPIGYPTHTVAMHPNMASARYPHNSSVVTGIQFQQQAPTGSGILRPNTFPS